MTACKICDMIQGKEKCFKIFENDKAVALLNPSPTTIGQVLLVSKEHFPIIEQVPDSLIGYLMNPGETRIYVPYYCYICGMLWHCEKHIVCECCPRCGGILINKGSEG